MSESLRELVSVASEIENHLIESAGLLTPELENALAVIEIKLPQKIDGYNAVLERMEMAEAYWKMKASEFQAVAKGCASAREFVKNRLKEVMKENNLTELVGNDVKFKLSNSKPKMIIDDETLDKAYFMQVTEVVPDKKRIEEDLKMSVPIAGAKLEETKSLRAYPNKGAK